MEKIKQKWENNQAAFKALYKTHKREYDRIMNFHPGLYNSVEDIENNLSLSIDVGVTGNLQFIQEVSKIEHLNYKLLYIYQLSHDTQEIEAMNNF